MTFKTLCITSTQGDDVAYCGGGDIFQVCPSQCAVTRRSKKYHSTSRTFVNDLAFK